MKKIRIPEGRKGLLLSAVFLFFFSLTEGAFGSFEDELLGAAYGMGGPKIVLELLKMDSDLDRYRDPNHSQVFGSLLRWAVGEKNKPIMEILLARKVDPNTQDSTLGKTALHLAAAEGQSELVEMLLAHHANVNSMDFSKRTPMYDAVTKNQKDIVALLLKNQGDPHLVDISSKTPLHQAWTHGSDSLVELLLQHTDLNVPDSSGRTPLHWAVSLNRKKMVERILAKGVEDINAATGDGFTSFHLAVIYSDIQTVELLLKQNANPNLPAKNGQTPLHSAARYNRKAAAEFLFTQNVGLTRDIYGQTPLHLAAGACDKKLVEFFLSKGMDPEEADDYGNTLLLVATASGSKPLVQFLLNKNVNRGAVDVNGESALHRAARLNHKDLIELFLANGMDLNEVDSEARTPLQVAAVNGSEAVVKFLLNKNASLATTHPSGQNALHFAAAEGYKKIVERLLAKGMDPNGSDLRGVTPFHLAIRYEREEVVRFLLSRNINLEAVTHEGVTALHLAASVGNHKFVRLLLDRNANVNATNKNGDDALDIAASVDPLRYGKVIRRLFDRMIPERLEVLKKAEKTEDFKKTKDFILNKIKICTPQLNPVEKEKGVKQFSEIIKTTGRTLVKHELSAQIGLSYPNLSLHECDLGLGECQVCFEDQGCYACPAANLSCSNTKCASCSQSEVEQLLVENKRVCGQCNQKIQPRMYDHIPGCEGVSDCLEERLLRSKLMEDPNWKFCAGEDCLYGARFEKDASKYLDCVCCDFKGCLECHKDHRGTCEADLADRKAMADLLNKGELVAMRKLKSGHEPDLEHPLYLKANDARLGTEPFKSMYVYIQDPEDPHFYDGRFRPCAHCGVITERVDGCNGMTCKACGKEYHWNFGRTGFVDHDYTHAPKQYELGEGIEAHY